MTDQKKGSGLDDLRSRLGLDSVLSKTRRPEPKSEQADASSAPGADPAAPAAGQPPIPGSPVDPGEAAPSVERTPSTDYALAVSEFEEPVAGEGEPEPMLSATHDMVDLSLAAPISKGTKMALVGGTAVLLVLALVSGFGFGSVMRDRKVGNEIIVASNDLLGQIRPVAERLNQFQIALDGMGDDYSDELNTLFTDTFQGSAPVVTARTISDARVVMTTGDDLAQDLLNYSLSTQIMQALVQEHMRKTIGDRNLIQRLLEGADEAANYAVIFDSDELIRNFRAYFEDAEANPYLPTRGYVVTFEGLEVIVEGEGDTRTFKYDVFAGGQRMQVDIYNILTLDREQLVTNPNEETALSRYRARVRAIRGHLETLLRMQDALILQLEERAAADPSFTI